MFSSFQAIRYLYGLQRSGIKLGLSGVRGLLHVLGNPHREFVSLHIAGTNGKGSTAAMLAAILTAQGYRTGLYTSPHLIDVSERIKVNGKAISHRTLRDYVNTVRPHVDSHQNTFFETITAIAFRHFADARVDVAVVETGLGGRLDATNVLRPALSIITTIGMDHTQILGSSLQKIAFEKGGIIKHHIPCVTGVRQSRPLRQIRSICRRRRSMLLTTHGMRTQVIDLRIEGTTANMSWDGKRLSGLEISLPGSFQLENVKIVLRAVEELNRGGTLRVGEASIRTGLAQVRRLTGLRGRFSIESDRPRIVADVAHNPDAMRRLVRTLRELKIRKPIIVFGVSSDKDYRTMSRLLASVAGHAVLVQARTARALDVSSLKGEFERRSSPWTAAGSVSGGVKYARSLAGVHRTIVVTGSHFVVGEAIAALEGKNYLTINQ